jgi:hypothetical protein
VTAHDFLLLARKFRDLGDAIGDQLCDAVNGDLTSQNPNALLAALPFLRRLEGFGLDGASELREEIQDFLQREQE